MDYEGINRALKKLQEQQKEEDKRVAKALGKEAEIWKRRAAPMRRDFASSYSPASNTRGALEKDSIVYFKNPESDQIAEDLLSYSWDTISCKAQKAPESGVVLTSEIEKAENRHPLNSLFMKCNAPDLDSLLM